MQILSSLKKACATWAVSWLMMVVFALAVMPKEYLHDALYHHHDVTHPIYRKGEFAFTKQHFHCSFVFFALAPFLAKDHLFVILHQQTAEVASVSAHYFFRYSATTPHRCLRGPPHPLFSA